MEILYTNCAGIDVHKQTVKVCLLTRTSDGQSHKEFRTYLTTTEELLQLGDWLKEHGCTHVAFEATGVYWNPVFNLLEGSFELLVVNAHHIKAVPGRKTDVKDAEWIAERYAAWPAQIQLHSLWSPARVAGLDALSSSLD
jgi:transposase